jgi:phage FluMu protein Com
MLHAEQANSKYKCPNCKVFGLTLEPTIFHTQGKQTNHYTIDAVYLPMRENSDHTSMIQWFFMPHIPLL